MPNPILRAMNQNQPVQNNPIGAVLNMLRSGVDPDALYQQAIKSNPKFAQFVRETQNKTPEEILKSYGMDPSILTKLR